MRPGLLILAVAMLALPGLGGCGGDDSGSEDVTALLDRALSQKIDSADVSVDAQLELDGIPGFGAPIRLEASGPFVSRERGLPALDIDAAVAVQGVGQEVRAGLLSTGDRVFVKFGGEAYEQPVESVRRANRQLREDGSARSSLGELGLEPGDWVEEGRDEGEEQVAGVQTRHVSAQLDVAALVSDLNGLAERSQQAVGGVAPGTPRPLTDEQIDQVADAVDDPRFDVYVGLEDDIVRRVSGSIDFVVPEAESGPAGGVEGGSLRFSIQLADVNGDQRIEAPANARPIGDLRQQLQGLGGLGAFGGGAAPEPDPEGPSGSNGGAPPDADVERYVECLDRSQPDDAAARERCAELLR